VIGEGEVEISGITFNECNGTNGGAIYTEISRSGKLTIIDSC
jgi:hypothetical protein